MAAELALAKRTPEDNKRALGDRLKNTIEFIPLKTDVIDWGGKSPSVRVAETKQIIRDETHVSVAPTPLNGEVKKTFMPVPERDIVDLKKVKKLLAVGEINKKFSTILPKEQLATSANDHTLTLHDSTQIAIIGPDLLLFKRPVLNGKKEIGKQMQSMREPEITTRIDAKSNAPVVSIRATQKDEVNGISEIVIDATGGIIDDNRPLATQYTEMVPFVSDEKPLARSGAILAVESVARKVKEESKAESHVPVKEEKTLFDVLVAEEEIRADVDYMSKKLDVTRPKNE